MRHGFWCHWKWVILHFACFWDPRKSDKCCRGVCMHQNILFLEFCYFGLWRTHLPNYEFWGPMLRPGTLFCRKKIFIFWCQLRPKMTIKGRKKFEIKGAEIRKKSWFLYVFSGTELFLNTQPLQKKHMPLKIGQLWLRQTFFSAFVVCLLCECGHFCAPINFKFWYVL